MALFRRRTTTAHRPSAATAAAGHIGAAGTGRVPGRCPACGGPGVLDHVDLVARRQAQHCAACDHDWVVSFADDRPPAAVPAAAPPSAARPLG